MNARTAPRVIEVDVIRHNHNYFHNRREDGETVVNAILISRERAMMIYEANEGRGIQRVIGRVNFGPADAEWSWTMREEAG